MSPYGLFRLSNPSVTRDSSSLVFYESLVAVWAVEIMFTRDSSSLVFYESLWAVWAVESMRHPLQQFVDDF